MKHRRTFIVVGTVVALIVVLGIVISRQLSSVGRDAVQSTDALLARTFSQWDAQHLWDNASPEFLSTRNLERVKSDFVQMRTDLGEFRSASGNPRSVFSSTTGDRVELEYTCEFEKATRRLQIAVERSRSGSWRVSFIRVIRE